MDITISEYLTKLGFSFEEAQIYLSLVKHGSQNLYELSKSSKVERTRIYRLLEGMVKAGLVIDEDIDDGSPRGEAGRHVLKAADPKNLEHLVSEQESKLNYLKSHLGQFSSLVSALQSPSTKVFNFKRDDGLREQVWNLLSAKREVVGFIFQDLFQLIGEASFKKWSRQFEASSQLLELTPEETGGIRRKLFYGS